MNIFPQFTETKYSCMKIMFKKIFELELYNSI